MFCGVRERLNECLSRFLSVCVCVKLKKGKLRGRIDIGLSVMSIKKKTMCIDLDADDSIYHLKVATCTATHNETMGHKDGVKVTQRLLSSLFW